MPDNRHYAAGGRVHIYKRTNSRYWQCQCSINGKSQRSSSKTESLEEARWFAEKWFSSLTEAENPKEEAISQQTSHVTSHETENAFQLSLNDKSGRILSAAIECVSQAGFKNTTMDVISEMAGLSPSTLYRYFPSRVELLMKVVSHVSQHEVNVTAGIAMGEGTNIELIKKCAWTFGSRAIKGRELGYALVAEPVESEIEIERLKYRRKLMRVFETLIENGMRKKEFPEQSPEVSAACIVGALFEALVGPHAREAEENEQERLKRVRKIVDFCIHGVS